ncbi:MAG: hypothetical protein HY064_15920 [Bacteroidetes bacterium]|nr:hypothetical protein [Bacteroidota bacterium]
MISLRKTGFCAWFFFFGISAVHAQRFKTISRPEKLWAFTHPFIAKKAYHISTHARAATDSLERAGVFSDGNGGQLDAFRHAYWMASLVQEISPRKACKLGRAHEKGNYLDWKKAQRNDSTWQGKPEDGSLADSLMCDMDLKNNESGIMIGQTFKNSAEKKNLISEIINADENGELIILKKDESGNYYDCDGEKIDLKNSDGKWYIPKCEVKSNAAVKRG